MDKRKKWMVASAIALFLIAAAILNALWLERVETGGPGPTFEIDCTRPSAVNVSLIIHGGNAPGASLRWGSKLTSADGTPANGFTGELDGKEYVSVYATSDSVVYIRTDIEIAVVVVGSCKFYDGRHKLRIQDSAVLAPGDYRFEREKTADNGDTT